MEKDEARFILRSFRPDGADAGIPDFSEALALAAKERDLGAWLARERSQDSEFADALKSIAIPCSLRQEIIVAMDCTERPKPNNVMITIAKSTLGKFMLILCSAMMATSL